MRKNNSIFILMILALITFLSVTFIFTTENGFSYDEWMMNFVDQISTPVIAGLMDVISMFGSSEVILIITLGLTGIFALKRNWSKAIFFFGTSVGGVVINFILKVMFQRERPGEEKFIEVFNYAFEIPSYSFPSGHTMRSTILILLLIYFILQLLRSTFAKGIIYIVGVLAIVGVALSRVFLEAHYLSDTLAAISISVVWYCICLLLFKKYNKNNATYRIW